jgi:propionate CoA-transferase
LRGTTADTDGNVTMEKEGKAKKIIDQVEHVTFSGQYAQMKKQPVLYVTERCVFALNDNGMELVEIAPGVDLEQDILALMDFATIIKGLSRLMDGRIFRPASMGLKDDLLTLTLEERLTYDAEEGESFLCQF